MKHNVLISLFLGCFVSQAHALQIVPIADNEMANVKISQNNLNHIAVVDDRIKRVKGIEGQYDFQEDADTGHLFLKSNSRKVISIFITTEKGKTYQLQLKPSSMPAETIVLQPTEVNEGNSVLGQSYRAPEDEVIHLMEALAHATVPTGFIQKEMHIKAESSVKGIRLTRIAEMRKTPLVGEVYLIQNNRASPYEFSVSTWLTNDSRAVAISQQVLEPHQTAILYRVVDHG